MISPLPTVRFLAHSDGAAGRGASAGWLVVGANGRLADAIPAAVMPA